MREGEESAGKEVVAIGKEKTRLQEYDCDDGDGAAQARLLGIAQSLANTASAY